MTLVRMPRKISQREGVLLLFALAVTSAWGLDALVRSVYLVARHRLEAGIEQQELLLARMQTMAPDGPASLRRHPGEGKIIEDQGRSGLQVTLQRLEKLAQDHVRIIAINPLPASGVSAEPAGVGIDCDGDLSQVVDYLYIVTRELDVTFETLRLTVNGSPVQSLHCHTTLSLDPRRAREGSKEAKSKKPEEPIPLTTSERP